MNMPTLVGDAPLTRNARIHRAFLTLFAALPALVVAAFIVAYWSEAWHVAAGGASALREYAFGSEAMFVHGGWHYRSPGTYTRACLAMGALLLPALYLFCVFAARRSALSFISGCLAVSGAIGLSSQAVLGRLL